MPDDVVNDGDVRNAEFLDAWPEQWSPHMGHEVHDRAGTFPPKPCQQPAPRREKGREDVCGQGVLEGVDLKQSATVLANLTGNVV